MRNYVKTLTTLSKVALGGSILSMLAACGGGSAGGTVDLTPGTDDSTVTSTYLGSVGDGPVINAEIFIYDAEGGLIATQRSDAFANYEVTFKTRGNPFPVTLEAIRGTDLVTGMRPDFTLKAVSFSRGQKRLNLNPFSTLVVEAARGMPGGITQANVKTATATVLREMNFGLDTVTVPDPVTTSINETNIANIVRASEALGETIRRTRSGLTLAGYIHSHNDIVTAIASDLTDGRLDGRGVSGTDARISSVASAASAQVLIEQFTNRLHVNGTLATSSMDNAISQTLPTTPADALTASVAIPQAMISQATQLLTALASVDRRPEVVALAQTIAGIPAGSTTHAVGSMLTDDHSRLFDATITNVAQATDETVAVLAAALAGDPVEPIPPATTEPTVPSEPAGPIEPSNQAPSIQGSPTASVIAGSAYTFAPSASDGDGDPLTFSIANRPAWASFDTRSGQLAGTPGDSHVGRYDNIVISASDGTASTSLPAFSITVSEYVVPNTAPVISGSPATTVAEDTGYSFRPTASDADGDALTFRVANRPAWLNFSSATGQLSGIPSNSDVGSYGNIVISVTDGTVTTALPAFSITVTNVNDAPTIIGTPATSVNAGSAYGFAPTAADVDGDALTFSVSNLPSWAAFNSTTGRISGTPTESHVGIYSNIVVRVSDGRASAQLAPFSIAVNSTQTATRDVTLRWVAPTTRSDGSPISLSQIAGFRIHYGTTAGNYTSTIRVNDGSTTSYTIRNMAPGTYYFAVTTIDSDGQESVRSGAASTQVQ